ncbi:MAG: TIGR00341 family protein [Gammaproteobacteria bacterium]|nr:TIGR00341 family protein [Gammaproteobacteria bacterium]
MSGKIIEINCRTGHLETLLAIADSCSARILSSGPSQPDGERASIRMFVEDQQIQSTLDRLQTTLAPEAEALTLLIPVDAQLYEQENLIEADQEQVSTTREELFLEISRGTECDRNFVLLVVLATVVSAIGIAEDNVAVVVGAMVIAPLLGPNLGLALGSALGDRELIRSAIFTNGVGVGLTIVIAAVIALLWAPNMQSQELLSRTEVRPASVILALASGIAAVQSLTTRLANILVGVMIAVALVPPATVLGLMLGVQNWQFASGAALLLAVNITAVNLAAQLVFLLRGVRPRTWLAQRKAKQASWLNLAVWISLLLICSLLIALVAS